MADAPAAFSPSLESAKTNLPNNTFTKKLIAQGPEGAHMSLEEVTDRVREGGHDPRMRAWAGKALAKAGKPTKPIEQAQAVLDALRAQTQYVADPVNTEMIAKPHVTLCLDEHGLCMPIGDCDDLVVCFASSCASIGIPVKVVGQAFGTAGPTHVIAAFESADGQWLRVDPSVSRFRVGQSHTATQEWWHDPLKPSKTPSLAGKGTPPAGMGTFIGVGGAPLRRAAAGVGASVAGSAATDLTGDAAKAIEEQVRSTLQTITTARNELSAALDSLWSTRTAVVGPNNLFDAEPPYSITSVANFPAAPIWTPTMDALATQTYDIASKLIDMGHGALGGDRQIILNTATNDVLIEAHPSDPWGIHVVVETASSLIFGFFDSAGTLISGMDSSGHSLTAAQVQAAVSAQTATNTGTSGAPGEDGIGVGNPVAIALIEGIAIAAVTLFAYLTVAELCSACKTAARQATVQTVAKAESQGTLPAGSLKGVLQAQAYEQQAEAASRKANNPFGDIANILKWATVGGIAVAGAVLLYPVAEDAVASYRASHAAKRSLG